MLDTLNKSLVGSENKDVDMGAYVRAAEAIRDRFGCVVIIVHHCGYDDTRPRGHSSLPGAVDAQLAVVRAENVITVTVEMMRDGPEDTQVVSAVEVIEVGQDQNGKTLTSLVVVPSDADAAGGHSDWPRGLRVFHAALRRALAPRAKTFSPSPARCRCAPSARQLCASASMRPTPRPRRTPGSAKPRCRRHSCGPWPRRKGRGSSRFATSSTTAKL